ncbi:MAG: folate-binding protein YgfZ [Sandaracinaceae bacterium]|nr:folate-binding protein YgfZ [Sandaracinaceae bacterium]
MPDVLEQAAWLAESVGVRALSTGVLRVRGEDARSWLNGQITNDVSRTRAGDAVYALLVDVRGKILSDLFALDRGDGLDLLVPPSRLAPLLAHLERYVVMEDVELTGEETVVVSAQGPAAGSLGLAGFACDRLGHGGLDLLETPLARAIEAARALGGGLVDEEAWTLARLRAARPAYGLDFDETNYPQEAALGPRAVSFTKGCYVGQEVVCTLESRGQLRRRLVVIAGAALPASGTSLTRDGVEVGVVRSGVVDPADGTAIALAYVKRASAEPGVELASARGPVTIRYVAGGDPQRAAP